MGRFIQGVPNPMPTIVRTVPDDGKRAITINSCQGIGDLAWCIAKLQNLFDLIHINILVTDNNTVQERAARWLEIFPKVGSISIEKVSHQRYEAVIGKEYKMSFIMQCYNDGVRNVDYACNFPLEQGKNLRDIDLDYPIESVIDMQVTECPLVYDNFIAAYVSGGTKEMGAIHEGCWSVNRWCEFILRFDKEFNKAKLPYIFVGASYDQDVITSISGHLGRYNITNGYYFDSFPANVTYILKKAKFFIGYQSGLSILADNLGTSQFMMYFQKLAPMMYTWCRPEHIKTKFFADTFKSTPYEAIQKLKDAHLQII